ncbi:MAG: hypothetical protein DKT66_05405 [Candidatus Melainabacteria bacterium]|nr:MAG: hypothetical protein DKT66_05405 [Candidatus Melainabacteria bacterium]
MKAKVQVKTTSTKNPAPKNPAPKATAAKTTKSAPVAKAATAEKPTPAEKPIQTETLESIKAPEKIDKKTAQSSQIQFEQIAQRAYLLFEQRGYAHGFDREDWLEAEKQLKFESLN